MSGRWLSSCVFLYSPKLHTFGVFFVHQKKSKADCLAQDIPFFALSIWILCMGIQRGNLLFVTFARHLVASYIWSTTQKLFPGLLNWMQKMATALPSSDDKIGQFLSLADLSSFDVAFQAAGVTKIGHATDITEEDAVRIGKGGCIRLFLCEQLNLRHFYILNTIRSLSNRNSQVSEALVLHEGCSLCSLCIERLRRDWKVPWINRLKWVWGCFCNEGVTKISHIADLTVEDW